MIKFGRNEGICGDMFPDGKDISGKVKGYINGLYGLKLLYLKMT